MTNFLLNIMINSNKGEKMNNIDYERLRKDLIDYFGSATPMFGVAYMDVIRVENASYQELIKIAIENGFDLSDYEYKYRR